MRLPGKLTRMGVKTTKPLQFSRFRDHLLPNLNSIKNQARNPHNSASFRLFQGISGFLKLLRKIT
jgi:hypothetical protein